MPKSIKWPVLFFILICFISVATGLSLTSVYLGIKADNSSVIMVFSSLTVFNMAAQLVCIKGFIISCED